MPKSIAIRQSELISVWTAVPLYWFYWIMYPAIWFLNTCSNFFLKLSGMDIKNEYEGFYSSEELKLILSGQHLQSELKEDEREILEHTLDLAELNVTEVMRPEDEMIIIDINEPFETIKDKF